jgi:predicted GNAT superfamily acetyltransferase
MVTVRRLKKPEEFHQAMEVQKMAWDMPDYTEAVPFHALKGAEDAGGMVLGAFKGKEMVGFSYAFLGLCEGKLYLHSHMTGVKEGWKYKGIGMALKLKQREEAIKAGLDLIMWTFEPLQSLNTYFNLAKLGTIFRRYHRNYYGMMGDSINFGMESDRVKAEWWVKSKRVKLKLEGRLNAPEPDALIAQGAKVALDSGENQSPNIVSLEPDAEVVLTALPRDIVSLKMKDLSKALDWRHALRKVYESYLSKGYIAMDLTRGRNGAYVVLWRKDLENILEGEVPWS